MIHARRLLSSLSRCGAVSSSSIGRGLCSAMLAWVCTGMMCSAQAPDATPAVPNAAPPSLKNSLGVPFAEVPGTPVLFAAWETRVSDFATFVRESGYTWDYRPRFPQSDDHPVVNVTLRDALAYCNWLTRREQESGAISAVQSYRLPTGKEWDAAVGLTSGRKDNPLAVELEKDKQKFPWGMEWPPPPQAANLNFAEISGKDDGYLYTAPVGRYPPSPEGLFDLAGNVWEWAWDRDSQSESVGILRGGSWMYFRKECLLSSYEYEAPSTLRSPSIGFRCVFEDKRRMAEFLTKARQAAESKTLAQRGTAATAQPATPEEVKRMREELGGGSKDGAKFVPAPAVPDPATLKAARAGEPHTNSLGMMFHPLSDEAALLVGVHEVRVQDFEAAMKSMGRSWDRKPTFAYTETHAVMNVTWQEAAQFCQWLTYKERTAGLIGPRDRYRLPKDAEWSRAAGLQNEKGDSPESHHLADRAEYPWGTQADPPARSANLDAARMTNGYQDNYSHTAPIGSFNPNKSGFHDLAGNVAEWCEDAWPSAPGERVIRGSSWLTSAAADMLTSVRQHLPETSARSDLGFRVVLEIAP